MFSKWIVPCITLMALALLAIATVPLALTARASEANPPVQQLVAEPLDTSFTYQGQLNLDGQPVEETCDFQFSLYDDGLGATQIGVTQTITQVQVTSGQFTVQLDFDTSAFQGDARWLGIAVQCPGDAAYTSLGLQALKATPYALYALSGGTTYTAGAGLNLSTGNTFNVHFAGDGLATTVARSDHDHWGESWSGSGTGLTLDSSSGDDLRLGGGAGEIVADAQSYSDLALYSNDNVDVHLDNDDNALSSAFNVRDDEDAVLLTVGEDGTISWAERTGYVSLPAAAFRPAYGGYDFHNAGIRLDNVDGSSDFYFAPVQLPHGATVTRLSFYYADDSATGGGVAELRVNDMDDTFRQMAYVTTVDGQASGYDDTISFATIDNSQYAYYVQCNLDDSDVHAYGVIIEYAYTEPY